MNPDHSDSPPDPGPSFSRRLAAVVVVTLLVLAAWTLAGVLLLVFAGVLLAIALHALATAVARRTDWGWRTACATALGLVVLVVAGLGWALGESIARQADELAQALPESVERLRTWLRGSSLGERLLRSVELLDGKVVAERMAQVLGAGVGALGHLLVALFLAVYLAADPGLYRRGALSLVPARRRARVDGMLDAMRTVLGGWLRGQALSMLVVGLATWAGLALLGVPLAMTLALIAALLEFVPFVGAIVAAVPALLIAFTDSPQAALHVAILYLVIQQLEGNLLQPLVQRRTTSLPPAVTVIAVVAAGVLLGLPGLLLGVPLAVVVMVGVQWLWVEPHASGDPVPRG